MPNSTVPKAENKILIKKVLSALFFAISSLMITMVNKTVLTVYLYPSYQVLGLGQMTSTILVLWIGKRLRLVQFPELNIGVARRIWPLPLLFLGNMATGLGSTKELNLPMFTALRRLSILMTMILEKVILGNQASFAVQASVIAMVAGAIIAAADDLTFSWTGYILVLLNDAFSAANGVYMKKILDAKELGMYGLLFYDSFFMFIPASIVAWLMGDLYQSLAYENWNDPLFVAHFLMSCVMGVVLSYSMMLCTHYNSALTTTIIGSLKNIIITYLGMVIINDYVFSWMNFIGLNISIVASLVYTYAAFKQKPVSADNLVSSNKEDMV